MFIPLDLAWLEAVALASVRMAGFVVLAPPFSYGAFPGQVKAMLAVGLAIAVSPRVVPGHELLGDAAFFAAIVTELVVGAAMGFVVLLAMAAVQAAGALLDTFGGFQLAQAFDPQSMTNGAQFSRFFHLAAIALLFSSGAYQVILQGLFRSFDALPVAAALDLAVLAETLAERLGLFFVAAAQIAGPLVIILFLADAGLGLLTRVAPQLNAFALGFPLKILLTLSLAGIVFGALPAIVASLARDAFDAVTGVF